MLHGLHQIVWRNQGRSMMLKMMLKMEMYLNGAEQNNRFIPILLLEMNSRNMPGRYTSKQVKEKKILNTKLS
jgi:hypothetical protein